MIWNDSIQYYFSNLLVRSFPSSLGLLTLFWGKFFKLVFKLEPTLSVGLSLWRTIDISFTALSIQDLILSSSTINKRIAVS